MTLDLPLHRYPGMNRFVLDWLGGDERFLRRGGERTPKRGSRTRGSRSALAGALDASNREWGVVATETLERWDAGETLTLIAGQQVGFAGGPLYTLAKLASLVRLKRDLEAGGIPVAAFFWLATEDHDLDEVAHLNVPVDSIPAAHEVNRQRDLLCMRAPRQADFRSVVGPLPLPHPLVTQFLTLFELDRPSWLREGITFRDSFAELIATIFRGEVILVDALLPELRRAGAPLFENLRSCERDVQSVLAARAAELRAAGYHEQVVARDGDAYTLLFTIDEQGTRTPSTSPAEPERTSTSALTRPLLQDSVIEPDIFIGGPAEVAYYAQIAPLHEMLEIAMPRVALRGHALVGPKRTVGKMERYGVTPAELFTSTEEVLQSRETGRVDQIRAAADEAKHDLLHQIERIRQLALPADHALSRSIQRSIGHLEYHFGKLAERSVKALVRKDRERYDAVRRILATFHPDGHVQDRITAWVPLWLEHGDALIDRLIEEIRPDSSHCRIIGI